MVVPGISSKEERSQPYLRVCLPPPLRFSPPPPPPEVADPTVAMGPASPGGPLEAIGMENKASAKPFDFHLTVKSGVLDHVALEEPAAKISASDPAANSSSPTGQPAQAAAPTPTPPPPPPTIIPDDTPQAVHSEDLLPYFRLPSSNPPALPPSSATYHQQ